MSEVRGIAEAILRDEGYRPHGATGLWIRDWPMADVFNLDAWLASNVCTAEARR